MRKYGCLVDVKKESYKGGHSQFCSRSYSCWWICDTLWMGFRRCRCWFASGNLASFCWPILIPLIDELLEELMGAVQQSSPKLTWDQVIIIYKAGEDCVKSEAMDKAVRQTMVGEKAGEMKCRTNSLGEMARKAVEEGGSSYNDWRIEPWQFISSNTPPCCLDVHSSWFLKLVLQFIALFLV